MSEFDKELSSRLEAIHDRQLHRTLRRVNSAQSPQIEVDGRKCLNFSSNDYLGLANDPTIREAAIKAIERWGAGSGASRLVCGSLSPHHELEEAIALFKGIEAAISFASGYAAAIGAVCALVEKGDAIILDKLVHASIVDAARLSGARLRVFDHNDLNDLEQILKQETRKTGRGKMLVVTESVFSMDGDQAPLKEIVELKDRYGAWLMVDEAHSTGLFGPNRRGLIEQHGISTRAEIQMGTLGKALGSAGGFISGSRTLVDYLINRARPFIFSTAPVPAAAAAATAAIQFVASENGKARCAALWDRIAEMGAALNISNPPSPILPLVLGDESHAMDAARQLRELGIFIPAIRFPSVARGKARLRLTLTAAHTKQHIQTASEALQDTLARVRTN